MKLAFCRRSVNAWGNNCVGSEALCTTVWWVSRSFDRHIPWQWLRSYDYKQDNKTISMIFNSRVGLFAGLRSQLMVRRWTWTRRPADGEASALFREIIRFLFRWALSRLVHFISNDNWTHLVGNELWSVAMQHSAARCEWTTYTTTAAFMIYFRFVFILRIKIIICNDVSEVTRRRTDSRRQAQTKRWELLIKWNTMFAFYSSFITFNYEHCFYWVL